LPQTIIDHRVMSKKRRRPRRSASGVARRPTPVRRPARVSGSPLPNRTSAEPVVGLTNVEGEVIEIVTPDRTASPAPDGLAETLIGLIATGAFDDHLGMVQAAIARRHRELSREASNRIAAELRIGDRVRVSRQIRPLYLRGATGTVVGWAGQSVVLQLDDALGRFVSGQVRCPPLGLERVT